jgi:disulfide bond formation protein DsbB
VPYALAALVAGGALAGLLGGGRSWPLLLLAGIFAAGGLIAVYHVGVEQHWWSSVAGCAGAPVGTLTIEDLRPEALAWAPRPCDRVDFRLLGLSLAGWNVLASAVLCAACLFGFTAHRRTRERMRTA